MKITKRGIPPGDRVWKGSCKTCGSEAEATRDEMTHINTDFEGDEYSWETCPVCDNTMYFYESEERVSDD